jgi:hypothetical protein
MNSLKTWEEIRLLGYILSIIGMIIFLSGVQINPLGVELSLAEKVLGNLSTQFKSTGTAVFISGGFVITLSEGLK